VKKPKFEKHKDIFKHFTILELEKAERVLSAVEDYIENNPNIGIIGFPISDLNCQMSEVKIAIPVLEAIKNNLFPTKKLAEDKNTVEGLQIYLPTQDITITKDKRLTGFYVDNFTESTLREIRLYLLKNKPKNRSSKIYLTLSNVGLKNEISGEVYAITGKRLYFLKVLVKNGPLTAKEAGEDIGQDAKDVSDSKGRINEICKEKLGLTEDVIISGSKGYLINPLYKITIPKIKISVEK